MLSTGILGILLSCISRQGCVPVGRGRALQVCPEPQFFTLAVFGLLERGDLPTLGQERLYLQNVLQGCPLPPSLAKLVTRCFVSE